MMRQMRNFILMLVAFVAQVSVAQEQECRQLSQDDMVKIQQAILSNDFVELQRYASYDIPEVDSILAMEYKADYFLKKCVVTHNMAWPLRYLDLEESVMYDVLPDKIYKKAFLLPTNGDMKYKMLDILYGKCRSVAIGEGNASDAFWNFMEKLDHRSPMAGFAMLVMAQAFGQNNLSYDDAFVSSLVENTAFYVKTWGNVVDNFNNVLGDYLAIGTDGVVKLSFKFPSKDKSDGDEYDKSLDKMINVYELLSRLIYKSPLNDVAIMAKQEPQFPGGDDAMKKFIDVNLKTPKRAINKGVEGRVIVGFDINEDGSVTNVRPLLSAHPLLDEEAVRVVKLMPNWIPGKRFGKPMKFVGYQVKIYFWHTTDREWLNLDDYDIDVNSRSGHPKQDKRTYQDGSL